VGEVHLLGIVPGKQTNRPGQADHATGIHKHRCCGVLAPIAKLRRAVIDSADPAGATLQILHKSQQKKGLSEELSAAGTLGTGFPVGTDIYCNLQDGTAYTYVNSVYPKSKGS
jgi:hypothetical protein